MTTAGSEKALSCAWRALRVVACALTGLVLSGCGTEPWVKPYERELLADPIMSFSRDPISDRFRQHVQEVREGARGAGTSEGGGCGCN